MYDQLKVTLESVKRSHSPLSPLSSSVPVGRSVGGGVFGLDSRAHDLGYVKVFRLLAHAQ